jgi:bifunctional non-homologous end joining protein LigD
MLPETAKRPLSLLRLPDGLEGEQFFQKHLGKGFPGALREMNVARKGEGADPRMYVTDARGLVAAVQMGTVEFHHSQVRADRLDRPDRLVIDLDPDEGLSFAKVRDAAVLVRDLLAEAGLPTRVMVTGGKGVHLLANLRRTVSVEAAELFARVLATHLAEVRPKDFVAVMSKEKRKGLIFIDWLRNQNGGTAVAPWSVRAHEGAPVAVPVEWDGLKILKRADGFRVPDALEAPVLGLPEKASIGENAARRVLEAIDSLK